jgi:hypothetical protein
MRSCLAKPLLRVLFGRWLKTYRNLWIMWKTQDSRFGRLWITSLLALLVQGASGMLRRIRKSVFCTFMLRISTFRGQAIHFLAT